MKIPSRLRFAATGLAALLVLVAASGLRAEGGTISAYGLLPPTPPAAPVSRLVIQNGKIMPSGADATLGNVIDLLAPRYGFARIILAGTADVRVHNLTLRLPESDGDEHSKGNDSELHDVLFALSTASGQAFEVARNPNMAIYTLALPTPAAESARHVAVFNLSALFRQTQAVEQEERAASEQTNDWFSRFREQHPKSNYTDPKDTAAAAELRQFADAHPELPAARKREEQLRDKLNRQLGEDEQRINQINMIIDATLHDLAIKDQPKLQVHHDPYLLVATGTDAALEVVGKIVTAVGGTAGNMPGTVTASPPDNGAGMLDLWANNNAQQARLAQAEYRAARDDAAKRVAAEKAAMASPSPIAGDLEFKQGKTTIKQAVVLRNGETLMLPLGDISCKITATWQPDGNISYKAAFERGSGKSLEVLASPTVLSPPDKPFSVQINDLSVSFTPAPPSPAAAAKP